MCYKYGMKRKGFGPGSQPMDGIIGVRRDTGGYWSLLYYDRKLTEKEVKEYELDYLGQVPTEEFMS